MEATELRIGNKLMYKFKDGWEEIDVFLNDFKYGFDKCFDKYKPIPLTEEWLLKFGFKGNNENGFVFGDNDVHRLKFFNKSVGYQHRIVSIWQSVAIYDATIKHVHQLQNLYFALTNKELKIK
ncbi:hypothetical protein Harreka1_48 [Olleya phage Harreka_1]|uniref:Uncharacterized protein n=1 Tax=Olleya phage Harreka_1 TaxID=2745673 RepID=A0A8E4ZLR2_9CAUD|nr:hypothetical protein M1M26_gp48 [Olleya phage Harreka_1]QQV90455.1 hypothetical protein Harreka1_48 [Olleya phage Harreka_1]